MSNDVKIPDVLGLLEIRVVLWDMYNGRYPKKETIKGMAEALSEHSSAHVNLFNEHKESVAKVVELEKTIERLQSQNAYLHHTLSNLRGTVRGIGRTLLEEADAACRYA